MHGTNGWETQLFITLEICAKMYLHSFLAFIYLLIINSQDGQNYLIVNLMKLRSQFSLILKNGVWGHHCIGYLAKSQQSGIELTMFSSLHTLSPSALRLSIINIDPFTSQGFFFMQFNELLVYSSLETATAKIQHFKMHGKEINHSLIK